MLLDNTPTCILTYRLIPRLHSFALCEKVWGVEPGDKATPTLHTRLFVLLLQEEYEDTLGNVFNKKTYEDLRRQGIL